MDILFLNHNQKGYGTYYRCYHLGRELSLMRHKVTLLCASKKNWDLRIRKHKINKNFTIITFPRLRFHKWHTGQTLRTFLYSIYAFFSKADIVHGFASALPVTVIPGILWKVIRKKPLLFDWDDVWSGGFADYHNSISRRILSFFEMNAPKYCDGLTVTTDFTYNLAKKFGYENKTCKVPNGCNVRGIKYITKQVARKKLKIKSNEKIIVSMGHTYFKSMELLLKSFKLSLKSIPDLKLYLVGKFDESKIDEKLFKRISNNVVIVGEVTYSKVMDYLFSSDVLALPMENTSIDKGRWPVRLGDYLVAGTPIVSNAVGEVKLILESYNCGLTSNPNDIKNFSSNIIKLFNDNKLGGGIRGSAVKLSRGEFSWKNIAKKLSKIYGEVIQK